MDYVFPLDKFKKQAIENGHSKEYLEVTTEYINNLKSSGLPVIFSLKHLSIILDIPYIELLGTVKYRDFNYDTYKIKKRRGGFRQIMSPKAQLKFIQRWIYKNILIKVPLDEACMGFRKKHSIKKNALLHKNKEAILKIDLYRFFDTITQRRVFGMFKALGYHGNLAVYLSQLTTSSSPFRYRETVSQDKYMPDGFLKDKEEEEFLPQGAPTSPYISNIIARKLDIRLRLLAEKLGVTYSRYADDITFSGLKKKLPSIRLVSKIINEESFYVNRLKTRIIKRGQKQIVTGLTVNNGVHVSKAYKKDLWKHIYFSKKFGPFNHLNRIKQSHKSGFKDWLLGRIHFIYSIEPQEGLKMLEEFHEIEWFL